MPKNKDNVLSFLEHKTNDFSERVALGMKNTYGWSEFTYQGLGLISRKIASYLINDLDIKKEEHVAIISESRVEFGAAFFATIIAGATFIPLDIKLTVHELTSIMSNCNPTTIFVSNSHVETVLKIKEQITSIKNIILLDENNSYPQFKSIYDIENNSNIKFRHRSLDSNAVIIYTSGTTGRPKGVQTTFRNLLTQITDMKFELSHVFNINEQVNILSILPMNHLFELTVGFASFLNAGYSIYYTKTLRPKDVLNIMKDRKIKFMITVPSFFKMLKTQLESDLAKESKLKHAIFNFKYHYIAKFIPSKFLKKILFKEIHDRFGNNFYGFLSGGAPMDLDMAKYFNRIGITVHQGYGLSEASPVVTMNLRKGLDIKSVGILLKSYEAKLDKDTGELLVKGPSVMKGYYNQEELTKEAIDSDGWLHTGDIAKIDKKGQVYITGRLKNMIVLAGGKKVFPEEIEAILDEAPSIKESCALSSKRQSGEKKGTEEVSVVACPKDELYEKYSDEEVQKLVSNEIRLMTQKLCQYKRPTNIVVIKGELPKTATRKIKRKEVREMING